MGDIIVKCSLPFCSSFSPISTAGGVVSGFSDDLDMLSNERNGAFEVDISQKETLEKNDPKKVKKCEFRKWIMLPAHGAAVGEDRAARED